MDGLLVDTETCDYEAWQELHAAHGLELSMADFCYSAGLYGTWETLYAKLAEATGISAEELHARRNPRFRELVAQRLRPSTELLALLADLRLHGIARGWP